jgi:uncharacterized protein YodC (DUF2158 family)
MNKYLDVDGDELFVNFHDSQELEITVPLVDRQPITRLLSKEVALELATYILSGLNQTFTVGDVVTLKSDPQLKMTVTAVNLNQVTCTWFKDIMPVDCDFPAETLTKE